MNEKGQIIAPNFTVRHDADTLRNMYQHMVTLNVMDSILYDAQRQGRISFYMTSFGEEASHIGSVSALQNDDVVFAQYRETGVLMWRGFTLQQFTNQCFANHFDLGKGRQMPVHYGSAALNYQTISSPLGTQIPQAAGAAYALKREGKGRISCCYFGEGAASEGDFHAALNMSATLHCPVIFFCRNNGYAISTPTKEQYAGDGIASRGLGYGVATIRVDGNDLFAVHEATLMAREYASREGKPVLIEAMTYRAGHHSTSDDSTRYRTGDEISYWTEQENPITRMRLYLEAHQLWDSLQEMNLKKEARSKVLKGMSEAEHAKKPPANQLFTDVYHDVPPHLQQQAHSLNQHLAKYPDKYNLDEYLAAEQYDNPVEHVNFQKPTIPTPNQ